MDPLINVVAFLIMNALFHESASSQFALLREAQGGGLNPPPLPASSVQMLTILSCAICPISGAVAFFIGLNEYKIMVWLPALTCWYVGFQAFRKISNPQLKELMACWGVVIVPYFLWLVVLRES